MNVRSLGKILLVIFLTAFSFSLAQQKVIVKAKTKFRDAAGKEGFSDWKEYETRTIEQLQNFDNKEPKHSLAGGRKDKKTIATGFFYTAKVDDRWWLVDPEGYLFIHKSIVTVRAGTSKQQVELINKKFGDNKSWLDKTVSLLTKTGFNGAGNWSDADLLKQSKTPFVYTRGFNFMAGYGKVRGGTFQQPGHTGYPNDLIFVFDPEFEKYCNEEAKAVLQFKDEKYLLGYFSDNEMPFPEDALDRYLKLDKNDYGFIAASNWLKERKQNQQINEEDRAAFISFMSEKYFSIVSKALKKYDPNHMYLGCRFYGKYLRMKPLFESAGKYMDVVSVNYYNVWTPKFESLSNWSSWSDKPILITEWYTKGEDSNMKNISGAGWLVPTQKDRGLFYQNFTLALLESKVCVGWHWFKYQDNDPNDKSADPSNLDSNKGIVDGEFVPYQPLLDEMKKINEKIYSLIDYFDSHKIQTK